MTGTVADLGRHLEETYGIKVRRMTPLEPWAPDGVQRVDLEGWRDQLSAIDWTGSGRGPRVQSLGTLGWVGHPSLIDAFVTGYREYSDLEPEELDRLDRALVAHGVILQAWGVAFRGAMPSNILQWLAAERKTTELVVERTRRAFEAPP